MHSTTHGDVPFPPDPNPRKVRFTLPPGSWDTHFHLFGPPHRFPYREPRRYTPPAAPIEHWQGVFGALGFARGVAVLPSHHDGEYDVLFDAFERSEGRVCGMIRQNPNLSAQDVKRLHRGGVRGVRFPFARELGDYFDEKLVHANLARIEAAGWAVAFQMDADALTEHADLLGNLPLKTILDAFGGLQPNLGLDQPALRALYDLLATPNIYVKFMVPDRLLKQGQTYENIVALARAIVAKAPDRIIWGSDWPHAYVYEANAMPNDGDLVNMLLDFVPDEATRNTILVDTPARIFDM